MNCLCQFPLTQKINNGSKFSFATWYLKPRNFDFEFFTFCSVAERFINCKYWSKTLHPQESWNWKGMFYRKISDVGNENVIQVQFEFYLLYQLCNSCKVFNIIVNRWEHIEIINCVLIEFFTVKDDSRSFFLNPSIMLSSLDTKAI